MTANINYQGTVFSRKQTIAQAKRKSRTEKLPCDAQKWASTNTSD